MQRALEKMAKQLNSYDEASLMQLWQQYVLQVNEFEPTKRWEEATLILCLIQAVRWKNQLFNYQWATSEKPLETPEMPSVPDFFARKKADAVAEAQTESKRKATVLRFPDKHVAGTASPDGETE